MFDILTETALRTRGMFDGFHQWNRDLAILAAIQEQQRPEDT